MPGTQPAWAPLQASVFLHVERRRLSLSQKFLLQGWSGVWAAGMEQPGHLQEEVLHDVVVVRGAAVWEEAGSKDDNGIETFSVVP